MKHSVLQLFSHLPGDNEPISASGFVFEKVQHENVQYEKVPLEQNERFERNEKVHMIYFVTNAHAISRESVFIGVRFGFENPSTMHPCNLLGMCPERDIAVLCFQCDERIFIRCLPVSFGDDLTTFRGDAVRVFGYPLGTASLKVTSGVISGYDEFTTNTYATPFIQTDAAINPGNSGGVLVDVHDRVVGIVSKNKSKFQNTGYAIPSRVVIAVLDDIIYFSHHFQQSSGKSGKSLSSDEYVCIRPPRIPFRLHSTSDTASQAVFGPDRGSVVVINRAESYNDIPLGEYIREIRLRPGPMMCNFETPSQRRKTHARINRQVMGERCNTTRRLLDGDDIIFPIEHDGNTFDSYSFFRPDAFEIIDRDNYVSVTFPCNSISSDLHITIRGAHSFDHREIHPYGQHIIHYYLNQFLSLLANSDREISMSYLMAITRSRTWVRHHHTIPNQAIGTDIHAFRFDASVSIDRYNHSSRDQQQMLHNTPEFRMGQNGMDQNGMDQNGMDQNDEFVISYLRPYSEAHRILSPLYHLGIRLTKVSIVPTSFDQPQIRRVYVGPTLGNYKNDNIFNTRNVSSDRIRMDERDRMGHTLDHRANFHAHHIQGNRTCRPSAIVTYHFVTIREHNVLTLVKQI